MGTEYDANACKTPTDWENHTKLRGFFFLKAKSSQDGRRRVWRELDNRNGRDTTNKLHCSCDGCQDPHYDSCDNGRNWKIHRVIFSSASNQSGSIGHSACVRSRWLCVRICDRVRHNVTLRWKQLIMYGYGTRVFLLPIFKMESCLSQQ